MTAKPQLTPPKLSSNALEVLKKRYLRKSNTGEVIETPIELLWRVASNIAEDNSEAQTFYEMMANLEFLPNSPTLINAGCDLQQLSACFVLPIGDSIDDIFDSIKHMALIHKSGGGTGFSFSRLRPEGSMVKTTSGVSSGPVSFMKAFNSATEVIKQGGVRRGANMGILRVDHPDILNFISCKRQVSELNNFNISVALTDVFMAAVEQKTSYSLVDPHNGHVVGELMAAEVFDNIVEHAWHSGEPGIVFLDEINRYNPTPHLGDMESTNPCGEQPLLPYEACNLGSINLARFVTGCDNSDFSARSIDFKGIAVCLKKAISFLDQVVDKSVFPLPEITEMVRNNRKIGLGVMGFADMLFLLGVPYNSERAISIAEEVMSFISTAANTASENLAAEKGAYHNFRPLTEGQKPLRNATRTTIAPTGTISILAGCSSGIEPLFALSYVRNIMDGQKMVEVNPIFEQVAKERGFYSKELLEKLADGQALHDCPEVPEDIVHVFVTAHDITPEWHIRLQAAFQKHVDNAVSKTVNFPKSATCEDVHQVFLMAHKLKLKGVTIYRDGSRDDQVLQVGKPEKEEKHSHAMAAHIQAAPRSRPDITTGITCKAPTGCGSIYVTINEDEDGPCEVFVRTGKSGGCIASFAEGMGRLISVALRAGVEPNSIIKQIKGVRCPTPKWLRGEQILSCSDAIGKVMEDFMKNMDDYNFAPITDRLPVGICPDCSSTLEFSEGCCKCNHCGFTKC